MFLAGNESSSVGDESSLTENGTFLAGNGAFLTGKWVITSRECRVLYRKCLVSAWKQHVASVECGFLDKKCDNCTRNGTFARKTGCARANLAQLEHIEA